MIYKKNKIGRLIPTSLEGIGQLRIYGQNDTEESGFEKPAEIRKTNRSEKKLLQSIEQALDMTCLADGMTISFHHHLRNGDSVLMQVVEAIAQKGIKDLTICSSSLTKAHEGLIDYIKSGVVTGIQTSGLRGQLAKEVTENCILPKPVIFRTHGGRARAVEAGEVTIDIAFIAASCCDEMGNMNGKLGPSAFGSMGYPMVDAQYACQVVAITDNLVPYPASPVSIPETLVDYVVQVDSIGDNSLISAGATRMTKSPRELLIADYACQVLIHSGYIKNGFSFQAGSGGASLAVIKSLKDYMSAQNITASFASGGITSHLVSLLEEGFFECLLDTQTFDRLAVESFMKNPRHIEMSASRYANPGAKSCVVDKLDIMILSATEVDTKFNVNVMTTSTGIIMGAQGGHPDTAAGAKLRVVVTPLIRKRIPIIVEDVMTVVTPGEHIDVVVTERGIAVNPKRQNLLAKLKKTSLPLMKIEELKNLAEQFTGKPQKIKLGEKIVGIIEYRDGSVIDVIHATAER